jgi:UDP-N-acetyl-D-galactosamine dehydrogenase
MNLNNIEISIVGLGYVGLPLAVEFGKKYLTNGIDVNENRIKELNSGYDRTQELTETQILESKNLVFSTKLKCENNESTLQSLKKRNVFIITVPTPIDQYKKPDLKPLISASRSVGKVINKGDVVIYESTVYPGCTEEDCVPILEEESGLIFNTDFFCGYSPERINPGDKQHTVTKIKKVTSGSNPEVANFVDELYSSVIEAGTFKAKSIKVAEAAKVIENCQRDINIAFVNELALIFERMEIDTKSVLEAAGSKWNFLNFSPGLVGGHCIGVDPYYLTHKAESLGYHPEVILSGRRINDNMGKHIASETIKLLIKSGKNVKGSNILVLGITFKENCPDIRNSKVIDIINELQDFGVMVHVSDPWANSEEVFNEYGVKLSEIESINLYDGIVLAVSHEDFNDESFKNNFKDYSGIIYDVKGVLDFNIITKRL